MIKPSQCIAFKKCIEKISNDAVWLLLREPETEREGEEKEIDNYAQTFIT